MGTVTADEVNFERLLFRCKQLCDEDIPSNIFKIRTYLGELEELSGRLKRNRNIDNNILKHYEQGLHELRRKIEPEQEKKIDNKNLSNEQSKEDDIASAKIRNKAIYHADLRRQLYGESEELSSPELSLDSEEITRREAEKQETLANELYDMARLMKQTYTTANAVIKEDNATLSRLHRAADSHKGSLLKESKRLEDYAYRSWCDCFYIFGVCVIIMSFIAMVLVMKVFSKKY